MLIKILLLGGFGVVATIALRLGASPRHLAVRRLAVMLLLAGSVVAVIIPDTVTLVAHLVGVGRGADLVLYALVLVSAVVWVRTYQRISALEEKLTRVVRFYAVADAAREQNRAALEDEA